jgi:thiol:disulfide interchange protein DsbC
LVFTPAVYSEETDDAINKDVVSRLKAVLPDIPIEAVNESPVKGIYSVELQGGEILYVTADGGYFFAGDLYKVAESRVINVAEIGRSVKRKALIDDVPQSQMVVFSPSGETKTHITVFTDVDCAYCRRLHNEIKTLNDMGIEVRYLAFPRSGIGQGSYDTMVSTWCAEDRNTALTNAKSGKKIPSLNCENPIDGQYQLGQQVGVSGTPAIITADGTLISGYLPAAQLSKRLGL